MSSVDPLVKVANKILNENQRGDKTALHSLRLIFQSIVDELNKITMTYVEVRLDAFWYRDP